jgi:DNA polymerase type B, organellar and viral
MHCGNTYQPNGNRQKYCKNCKGHNAARKAKSLYDATTEFIGVDGEGTGDGNQHKYVLLGVGDSQIDNPEGLSTDEIFTFLWECFLENSRAAYVGFYLGYDFTQWLKGLPLDRAIMLYSAEGIKARTPRKKEMRHVLFPVFWGGWEFDILGDKRFRIRRTGHGSWLYVCDTGPFFQTSLLRATDPAKWPEPVCTTTEYAILSEGKSRRDIAVLSPEMRKYNALENEILARLMHRIEIGFIRLGVRLGRGQWFGPGQAASKWLSNLGTIPKCDELKSIIPHEILKDFGRYTYYGGWFEIMAHGIIPGTVYEYDINSAYPRVIANLPCLEHGDWTLGRDVIPEDPSAYTICHVLIKGSDNRTGPVPHRDEDGNIARHWETNGWYWKHEIDAATRAGLVDSVEYLEWCSYKPCPCPPPVKAMERLYEYRLSVGKDTPEGKSAKLIYNSVYGKFAQSIGDGGTWGNPVYASLITAGCRTKILDAIATHPMRSRDLVMVATDALYFRTPHPNLQISNKLGEWSHESHEEICLFKPGVYWDNKARSTISGGGDPTFKARGFAAKDFARNIADVDAHYASWTGDYPKDRDPERSRKGWHPRIHFRSTFSMITCRQALNRHNWSLAGEVGSAMFVQDGDPILKRRAGEYRDGVYWSRPHVGWPHLESTPYEKRFGQVFDLEAQGYGLTEDGFTINVARSILRPEA